MRRVQLYSAVLLVASLVVAACSEPATDDVARTAASEQPAAESRGVAEDGLLAACHAARAMLDANAVAMASRDLETGQQEDPALRAQADESKQLFWAAAVVVDDTEFVDLASQWRIGLTQSESNARRLEAARERGQADPVELDYPDAVQQTLDAADRVREICRERVDVETMPPSQPPASIADSSS